MTNQKDVGRVLLYPGDHLAAVESLPKCRFVQLLLWSTPYPGQRGFNVGVDEYLTEWLPARLNAFLPLMKETGVYAQVVKFKRRTISGLKGTYFDRRVFKILDVLEDHGLIAFEVSPWDKLNAAPSGNHERHDRDAYEFIFLAVLSDRYKRKPYLKPYAPKTVAKAQAGKMRQTDIFQNLGGGHSELNPDGAAADNVFRISSSGDQNRPRAVGGSFPRELAQRLIFQYTDPDDWVFDPCMGVGTSAVEAIGGLCNFIGAEIRPRDFKKAQKWIGAAVNDARLMGNVDYTVEIGGDHE